MKYFIKYVLLYLALTACTPREKFDIIIKNGVIYDGSGSPSFVGDVAINSDTIAAIGDLKYAKGKMEIDASNNAISPGFINVQSWAGESLIEDGCSQSDIRQGVTLEVMGEGWSSGPLNETMKKEIIEEQGDIKYNIEWNTLGEYLEFLEKKGVSTNIASYIGATTVRINVLDYQNRPPSPQELDSMKALVRQAMEEGAIGISSALIYAPASFAHTDELVELCKEVAKYQGIYISHIRSEGDKFLEGLDELIRIAEKAQIHAEIYHLKAAGTENWYKMDLAIQKIDSARLAGLNITANMYNYTAAGTYLFATMPQWVQEGGQRAWIERLKDPVIKARLVEEMNAPGKDWENFLYMVGSPDNIMLVGFKNDSLKYLTGKTLTEISELRHTMPAETIIDLVIQDNSPIAAVYFLMSEENIKKQIALPWLSFGSDEQSLAPAGNFLKTNPHPRAYGSFSRLLGKYVRDEKVITLEEAIRKLTFLPATNLKIRKRGLLKEGYFADVVVFDPAKIVDHATFANPHQYSTGVEHVFVNGQQVLKDGEHTGALPGRFVKGPGWKGKSE
ncbi:MAG: D-aminoacylase [Chlorobi bacterium]|nr:D-aminoacylase [Chlorobiota bacterium]